MLLDVTTRNKYRIRVDHDEVYDVYFRSNDVIDFPLIVGTMNDVTSSVFHDIRSHAFVVQLVSLHNNPGNSHRVFAQLFKTSLLALEVWVQFPGWSNWIFTPYYLSFLMRSNKAETVTTVIFDILRNLFI